MGDFLLMNEAVELALKHLTFKNEYDIPSNKFLIILIFTVSLIIFMGLKSDK